MTVTVVGSVTVVGFDKPQWLRVEWVLVSQQVRDSTRSYWCFKYHAWLAGVTFTASTS